MKTQIKKELHNKSIVELRTQLKEVSENMRELRLDHEMGKLKNTSSLTNKRVELAVIKTILNEKLVKEKFEKTAEAESEKNKTAVVKTKAHPASAKASADKEGGKNE